MDVVLPSTAPPPARTVQPPEHLQDVAFPRDDSPQDHQLAAHCEEGLPADELAKRQARLQKRGVSLRKVLGTGTSIVNEVGDYKRKKVRVFVQYEGFQPGAIERKRELRVALALPDSWVDAPARRLKETFLKTYNQRFRKRPIAPEACLLATKDASYLSFSKDIIGDDRVIGDVLRENEEVFVVTEADVAALDAEVEKLKTILTDYEQEVERNATVDMEALALLTTVSREIDPEKAHCLLIGMKQCYMLPVEPGYTVADVKRFINHKGGRDAYPLGSLDIALVENFEINVLGDAETMAALCTRVYGAEASLEGVGRKVAAPLYWGKRLQDPKYFFWIPTLHTPDSFRGPGEGDDQAKKSGAEMANDMVNSGGECSLM